jgi:hypothetical protein
MGTGRKSTPNNSAFWTLIAATTAWVSAPILVPFLSAGSVRAQNSPANYAFVVASGFLCDPSDSGSCPAVAKSVNGESYEISGAGSFDPQNKSTKAAGTFNHKSTNGNVVETGVWTASALLSFDSYGIKPAAFIQRGPAFGGPQMGSKRMPMRSGPVPTGGLAILRILLMPMSGAPTMAVLQINCALGDVPRERSVEGIRLSLEKGDTDFSEEAGGRVMFLSMRPEARAPTKTPQQEPASEPTEPPSN